VSDEAIFYAIPGSHPARTGHLMLEQKGIPFRRVDLVPGFHRVYVRLRGFPGDRVPAVRFADGRRAQGTRPLARALLDVRENLWSRPAGELMDPVLPERA
jgi:hypothetical protein